MEDQKEISNIITGFCKSLLGSSADSLEGIDIQAMRDGPQLTQAQALDLIQPISFSELEAALNGIHDSKSPGLDGFNSYFFKKSWSIIKDDIFEAVNDFFVHNSLHFPVNITAITLIPKFSNAFVVKDLRPISCCSVVYKLVAKILTPWLQTVVCDIMNLAQSGFIPVRQIVDNVCWPLILSRV